MQFTDRDLEKMVEQGNKSAVIELATRRENRAKVALVAQNVVPVVPLARGDELANPRSDEKVKYITPNN